ncbi:hypothetical protein FRB94_005376 [Tulasnella sp. JGI-2019a]|nr:hypothetical protein FRB94_005376 [Tulasnella sp. JGI-2019a]KAG9004482.1 hypothetical protein FRB93_010259 [Tulasnella sp. JGI-2019a]
MTTNGTQWQSAQTPAETIDLTRDDFDEDDEDEEGSEGSIASDSERNAKRQKTDSHASAAAASSGGYNANGGAINHLAGVNNGGGGAYRSPQVLNTPPMNPNFTPSLGAPLMQPSSQWMSQTVPTGYLAPPGGSRFPSFSPNGSATQTPSAANGQNGGTYFPNAGPSPSGLTVQHLPPSYSAPDAMNGGVKASSTSVIDLTASNTPSPGSGGPAAQQLVDPSKQRKDSRKDVICIGELQVTALVLYPIPYLVSAPTPVPREEYVSVRLIYDAAVKKRTRVNEETIRITAPTLKGPNGEQIGGEDFGVVEQRVANVLGPLMSKVLIRVSATIRRAAPSSPILSLRILIFTPKGNVNAVSQFLQNASLFLDHPSVPYDPSQHRDNPEYHNPHNPPPGGFRNASVTHGGSSAGNSRWNQAAVAGKSVEVQRSQVDEVFNSLRSGEDLPETEPGPLIGTNLYPHQKKALTFLLEREKERSAPVGKSSSLWQPRPDPHGRIRAWYNVVTTKEVRVQPVECKGAILADDMGLGKTISVVSLIANTLASANAYVGTVPIRAPAPPPPPKPVVKTSAPLTAAHFAGSVWGMPDVSDDEEDPAASAKPFIQQPQQPQQQHLSAKLKAKAKAAEQRSAEEMARAARIKAKSRATLIVCPLSTVVNWEDQFKEHWAGEVIVVGGATGVPLAPAASTSGSGSTAPAASGGWSGTGLTGASLARGMPTSSQTNDMGSGSNGRKSHALKVYVYHGTSRRPDPNYLADFDAVITTYSTLASEFSKQYKSIAAAAAPTAGTGTANGRPTFDEEEEEDQDDDDDDDGGSSDGIAEVDMYGREVVKEKKKKTAKRKRPPTTSVSGPTGSANEISSPLQMVNWFRVVLDEAHSIKETSTIGSRACCDLIADRRLCLTGTPVQNKLDDVYALIKFLRFEPFDDKSVWTEYIGGPAKFGQPLGVARLQTIMKSITLRRTKETKASDGKTILDLPPRRDELRYLKFDQNEKRIYDSFFDESKAEFTQMSKNNEVMKNYVGILQKILRLRQICDHFELVQGKAGGGGLFNEDSALSYDDIIEAIKKEGLNLSRATAVFALLRESGTAQCVECGMEVATSLGTNQALDGDEMQEMGMTKSSKRGRKPKNQGLNSRGPTRASSPTGGMRPVLTRCQHLFCIDCFRHSTCADWPNVPQQLQKPCSACGTSLQPSSDAVEISPDGMLGSGNKARPKRREKKAGGAFTPSTKVKALLGDLIPFSRSNPYSANYDPNSIEITMCDKEGNEMDDGPVKTVVFSQWTSMLDKVEDALEAAQIKYDRLDGTMKRDDRTRAMEALKTDPRCEVLLVSLRAGGVGLNLTAARRVYLLDPYWNPAVENQAVDRIHRLGQKHAVTTIKFVIEDSIETRLLEVQKRKTQLANMTLGQTLSKAEIHQRRLEELNQLFSEGPAVDV